MSTSKPKRMADRVALVTGAASGIGMATARRLADEGARVALADVNDSDLAKVTGLISQGGGQALPIRLDVTSEADWRAAMEKILTQWRHLDLCVNCAGVAFAQPIANMRLADWRRVLATNLDSVFLGTRQAMSAMKDRGGCIINVASAAGIKPLSGNAVYGTSKAAIRFFTRVAALEGAPHHIRVNSISPGAVATLMWESSEIWPKQVAEGRGKDAALAALVAERGFAEPGQIAAAVLFLASDDARHVTGADLRIDDGFAIS
jgi:NAD(P)-dependent dehydrogenase (short-subunit alcohol dehydrogenase family)